MTSTLASVAPEPDDLVKQSLHMRFSWPRDSSCPPSRINGNASLKKHNQEKVPTITAIARLEQRINGNTRMS